MEIDPDLGCRAWFWILGAALALLQGTRGVFLNRDVVRKANAQRGHNQGLRLSRADMVLAYQLPDFILNASCTIAGFVALAVVARVLHTVADLSKLDLGAGVFLSALLFVAVAGIAGILPWILSRTTYPGGRS